MKKAIVLAAVAGLAVGLQTLNAQQNRPIVSKPDAPGYDYPETRDLVQLVDDAAALVRVKGDAAFADFRRPESQWRHGESYVFVLDTSGRMVVHPDATMEGKNQLALKDVNGKPIIRGLIDAATIAPGKQSGWYHYQWPVPGEIFPRWKSAYVRSVNTPAGATYIVGSGVYNDRMERSFVVDIVEKAVAEIEKDGEAAYARLRDPTREFIVKDTYVFVTEPSGVEVVNPGFRNLEGRNILDVKDTQGKALVRDMLELVQRSGSGWVDYMWPKPGESVSTKKSAYVSKARMGDGWVLVGCGVYLAQAPKAIATTEKMSAPQLMKLVDEATTLLETQGEKGFSDLAKKGSKWLHDDTYIFVRDMSEGIVFHPVDRTQEGRNMAGINDAIGRPYGKMFNEAAMTPAGEGWVHYMYPEPGKIFPLWKSAFVKRATFPSGKQYIVGCGIYNMQMDESFMTDVVNRASALVMEQGKKAFDQIRDKKGPFVFMDVYVFVSDLKGNELVNGGHPQLEGRNVWALKDVKGNMVGRACIEAVANKDAAWVDYYWYKPGDNIPARKHTYVRKVWAPDGMYVVGAGYFPSERVPRYMSK